MSAQAIERNYRKNPHTARFLQTFHSANGANNGRVDLLDEIPVEAPAYAPSPAQGRLIVNLTHEIRTYDVALAEQAETYTARMEGHWNRANLTRWIDHLIVKARELKSSAVARTIDPPVAQVADGRYAVEEDGVLKFFKVKNGRRAGFIFLDIQASDDWHAIRNVTRIREIVAIIAVDAKAAMIRYGQELGECGHCGRTLTDETSRAAGIGPICRAK